MKLKEFIQELKKLENRYGDTLEIIYSSDNECNYFKKTEYNPSVGIFEDNEFDSVDNLPKYLQEDLNINAICIN